VAKHNWNHNLCIIVRVYLCIFFSEIFLYYSRVHILCCFLRLISVFIYILWVQIEQSIFTCDTCYFTLSFLPISKLFGEKGSLNPMERWSNLIGSLVNVVRSEWFNRIIVQAQEVLEQDCQHLKGQINDAYFANKHLQKKLKLLKKIAK